MRAIGKGVGMPLIGVPTSVTPELLYALARCGHGDRMVIADANFPSDSVATSCVIKAPIRVSGSTSDILKDILNLLPLDQYLSHKIYVMDRVQSDKDKDLHVPAYEALRQAAAIEAREVSYVERFDFYKMAKEGFVVIQTDDTNLYANVIISKGVL